MAEQLLTVGGVTTIVVLLTTVLFQYFPGLRTLWGGVKSEVKMLLVLALYIVVGAFVAFGGCIPGLTEYIPGLICADAPTFFQYVFAVLLAIGGGQGAFSLMPEKKDVTLARELRLS
jgi:hypothetical protein